LPRRRRQRQGRNALLTGWSARIAALRLPFSTSRAPPRILGGIMIEPVPLPPVFGQNGFEPARSICRGAIRLLHGCGYAAVTEMPLPSGRRADIAAIGAGGEIWIVEVKSCLNDFRTDTKWAEYRDHCDRLFFAVNEAFPAHVLPQDAGLMVVDAYGGAILREARAHPLGAATRKATTLRIARAAASRLSALLDPRLRSEF
jgi:hypothetical protein